MPENKSQASDDRESCWCIFYFSAHKHQRSHTPGSPRDEVSAPDNFIFLSRLFSRVERVDLKTVLVLALLFFRMRLFEHRFTDGLCDES